MEQITESGITLLLRSGSFFRLGECQIYRSLGNGVKEMDVCWLDHSKDTFWGVELKEFNNQRNPLFLNTDLSKGNVLNEKLDELEKKTIHTISILCAKNRLDLSGCTPNLPLKKHKIKLIHILVIDEKHEQYVSFMSDKLNQRLNWLKAIFAISEIKILSHKSARDVLSWVQ